MAPGGGGKGGRPSAPKNIRKKFAEKRAPISRAENPLGGVRDGRVPGVGRGARLIVLDYLQALQPGPAQARLNIEQQVSCASNTVRDLAVSLGVRFIVVCTESREGELRYSDAIRYDAWRWIQMRQPEENTEDNPVYICALKKNRFGVLPKNDRELYRVGDRLLSKEEWTVHAQKSMGLPH